MTEPVDIIVQPRIVHIEVKPGKAEVVVSASGPQGPMGPPGQRGLPGAPGGSRVEHVQSSPSSIWVVNHDLGYEPHTTVIIAGEDVSLGADVFHSDPNNLTIVFSEPLTGKAVLS